MEIVWLKPARRDLERIYQFNLSRSEAYAARIERRLFERVSALANLPFQGRSLGGSVLVLSIPDVQYVVVYQPLDDRLFVLSVRNTREVPSDSDLLR